MIRLVVAFIMNSSYIFGYNIKTVTEIVKNYTTGGQAEAKRRSASRRIQPPAPVKTRIYEYRKSFFSCSRASSFCKTDLSSAKALSVSL